MEKSKDIKVYSEAVKAGKRSYFFDIKPTKSGDYYLVITEKKWTGSEGTAEKHRVFLYKEDINKFSAALNKAVDHMKEELLPDYDFSKFDRKEFDRKEDND